MTSVEASAARADSVADLTRQALGSFSAGERKVARALLAAYPVAGLETVAQLAKRANVSPPTVVRFVARLGYSGYPDFQRALMREVNERMGSPLEQYATQAQARLGQELLSYAESTFAGMLNDTFSELPQAEFAKAVDALSDPRRQVHLLGGRFSRVLADHLRSHLHLLRSGVSPRGQEELSQLALLADAGRSDLLVLLDFRRYDLANIRYAEALASRGATILLLTDRWMSPAAEFADVVLPARVEAPSPFDSLVPAMAVVESLVAAVAERFGEAGQARLAEIEADRRRWQGLASPPE